MIMSICSAGVPATGEAPGSERPSYSSSHLSELKAQTLSTPPAPGAPETYDDLTRSKFGSLALSGDLGDEALEEAQIPSTSTIQAAKDRRQLARKTGIDPISLSNKANGDDDDGFIPLSSTSIVPAGALKGGESRLVREDDELGEGEDEHAEYTGAGERVALGRKAGKAAERKRREGMLELIDDAEMEAQEAEEDDEEEKAWEAAQIRRGGAQSGLGTANGPPLKPVYRPAPIPEPSSIPNLNGVQARLVGALQDALSLESEQVTLSEQLVKEEDDLLQKEGELRDMVDRATTKEEWFNDLRNFVEDVGQFFRAKWSALEKVEADQRAILAERAEMIDKRRAADLSDDLALWRGLAVPFSMPSADDETAKGDESDEDTKMEEGDVDELGRIRPEKDTSPSAPSRQSRRTARRARRDRRKASQAAPVSVEDDGFSTDDELNPSDASDLVSASRSLIEAVSSIFADVGNDFFLSPTTSGGLADRFADWRRRYPEEYDNAFGVLALVQAWEFWARAELAAGWNLWGLKDWAREEEGAKGGEQGLEGWEWMQGLEGYEHPPTEDETPQPESESLVGAMVTSVVVPLLAPLARTSYDPYSSNATSRAVQLVEQAGYVLDRGKSGAYETLVQAFLSRFQSAVAELRYLVGSATSSTANAGVVPNGDTNDERERARRRAMERAVKLLKQGLRWRRFAKGLLLSSSEGAIGGGSTLERLLGSELVGKVLLPLIERGPPGASAEVARRVRPLSTSFALTNPID